MSDPNVEPIRDTKETPPPPIIQITVEMIEGLNFPDTLPVYSGEGVTSYRNEWVEAKFAFLTSSLERSLPETGPDEELLDKTNPSKLF